MKKIKPSDRVIIIHDEDCDGICSGVITALLIRKILDTLPILIASEPNVLMTNEFVDQIEKENPDCIIILDLPQIPQENLEKLSGSKILIIDHHPPDRYIGVVYCNPRNYEPDVYVPTTYLAYKIYQELTGLKDVLWIACVGVLADRGVKNCIDLFRDLESVHPELINNVELTNESLFYKSPLGTLVRIVDSGRIVKGKKGAEFVSHTLVKTTSYGEIFEKKTREAKILFNWYRVVDNELNRLIKDFKRNKKRIGKKIVFYELESKFKMKSSLASYLQVIDEESIIVIGQTGKKYFYFSIRKGKKVKTDLSKLVKKIIVKIPGSSGGGHPEAAGGRIPLEYKKRFISCLEEI